MRDFKRLQSDPPGKNIRLSLIQRADLLKWIFYHFIIAGVSG
jgi:hypothetical protein